MRSLLSSLLSTVALLSAALVSSTVADETVVHLPEDAAAGQSLGEIRNLLRLAPTERAWLEEGQEGTFRIDSRDRLVVAPRAALDHESQSQHRLTFRIIDEPDSRSRRGDPLRTRFKDLVSDQQEDEQSSPAVEDSSVRSAIIRILIDDVAEPPVLLGSRFRVRPGTPPRPGQRIGRAIAIDLDREEQHHFELLDGAELLSIDPASGELFLHENVNPLTVAALQAVVRVTDRAGLSAQASYRVWLNDSPPAPPLPFRIKREPPETEKASPVEAALASVSATPPPPPMPHVVTETTSTNSIEQSASDTTRHAAPGIAAPRVARPRTLPSEGPTWLARMRELLSPFGLGRFEEHRREWLIVAAVVVCVAVIVLSGVRDAVVAGRKAADTPQKSQPASSPQQDEAQRTPAQRNPQEISEILERLDAVIGKNEHATGDIQVKPDTADSTASAVPATDASTDASTDEMRTAEVAAPAATVMTPDDEPAESIAVATAESAAVAGGSTASEHAAATEQTTATVALAATEESAVTAESAVTVYAPKQRQPRRKGTLTDEERERIEQFREISRMMNRADIGRHHRERMRDEWLSVGVTSLACVVTGTVCVFTGCFGSMSVPLSSVMFSIATVLLMRPSLYPQFPPYDTATSQSSAKDYRRSE